MIGAEYTPAMLSQTLLRKNKVSEEAQLELCKVYSELVEVLHSSKVESISNEELDKISAEVERLEFKLQELWNFTPDANYHRYWLSVGDCCCPSDNLDIMYFGRGKIITSGCRVHSRSVDWNNK